MGRMLFTWAILYLTFFLGSKRKAVQGILFAAAAIGALAGIAEMLDGWVSFTSEQTFMPFSVRVLVLGGHRSDSAHRRRIPRAQRAHPIAVAVAFAIVLPWCYCTVD